VRIFIRKKPDEYAHSSACRAGRERARTPAGRLRPDPPPL
jgi:hypothetical protein